MAEDRDSSLPEIPPDGTRDAVQKAVSDTVLSIKALAEELEARATLAEVNVSILLYRDGGPGTFAYHFSKYSNATDPIERTMFQLADDIVAGGEIAIDGQEEES